VTEDIRPQDFEVPRSVAVIMDGNGRWARNRRLVRTKGHEHASEAVRETVEESARLGVEALILYAFSEENWQRPESEIRVLMSMLRRFLADERDDLMDKGIRLLHAGRRDRLPADVLRELDETVRATADNEGMKLVLALSYGGRSELVDATRKIAERVADGELSPEEIDELTIDANLYQPDVPHPDLLIRTAHEMRISNFLLWQISYSEIWFTDVLWPDFRKEHLREAFRDFGQRVRKFGSVVS
jgi:undecaprenyl diphosphate synthase